MEGDPEKLEEREGDTLEEERTDDITTEAINSKRAGVNILVKGANKYLKVPWLCEAYEQR